MATPKKGSEAPLVEHRVEHPSNSSPPSGTELRTAHSHLAASTVAELDLEEPAVEERAPKLRGLENPAAVSHQWKTSVAQPVQAAAILLAERRARQI
ncbi:unnamed protein product [Lampetra planeri]